MKSLLVCALLAIMPFSSVRMVCFNSHPASAPAAAGVATAEPSVAAEGGEDDCARFCLPRPAPPEPATTCALVADPTCAFLTAATVAVMPPVLPVTFEAVSSPFEPVLPSSYFAPVLDRRSPPPRA